MTRYLVLIGDGMSDYPLKELGGKTPLEAARTPNLDYLARNGVSGWTSNVPRGMDPGSDVAAMSIFGYDPRKYYTGRGPLEAASLGVKLKPREVAFRCNLVTVKKGRMESFTAHHVKTKTARKIFKALNKEIGTKEVKFYPGLSYRNLLVIGSRVAGHESRVKTTPPHDITGKRIKNYLPKSDLLIRLMNESEVLLHGMKTSANMIWPWGQGAAPRMPLFRNKFGKRAAVITAVHLLKGLGRILGMEVINVPGATGYLDTNYLGKAKYALKALKRNDVVFVHVEAPDEAGHEGNIKHKIRAIEDFDKLVVGTVLRANRMSSYPDIRILVLPDHPTPISLMTHTAEAVPFAIYPARRSKGLKGFSEKEIRKAGLNIKDGRKLLSRFLGGSL